MEYPRDIIEFMEKFPGEQSCIEFLEDLRFGKKKECPFCGHNKTWIHQSPYYRVCSGCRKNIRPTAGTIFHDQRVGLQTLFLIIWLEIMSKRGMSSEELATILPISQPSALVWLRKFREIMTHDQDSKLVGDVEVDEVFVGGVKAGKRGRGAEGKVRVVIAVEINQEKLNKKGIYRGMGRVRISIVPNCGRIQLHKFIKANIEKGSVVYTDDWKPYATIEEEGYKHEIQKEDPVSSIHIEGVDTDEVTPNVHLVASLLKRYLLGTHQKYLATGGYLQEYLEAFTFRYNRRRSKNRGKLFREVLTRIISNSR